MTRKECIDGMQRVIDEDRNKILVRVHVGYLIHAVKYLKDQPGIVRCKDCKFRQSKVSRIIDGKECNYCEMVKGYKPAGWFCADGIRR